MWIDPKLKENKTEKFIEKLKRLGQFFENKRLKSRVVISRVIRTRGTHSWVETDKGIFRKENKNIPQKLFN